ncbi:NAD(P)H dehydrogenase [quinone] 1 isoform X2 [Genypterus blacodes]|uniref:NAD(P)H dehydrogenase [quinone] 1 isoform X2 n=1 Tax=Genypterus blacodes TaxID=154954 RepID=UPI003F76F7CF
MMAQKTVLIVYAHHSAGSFNAAVRDVAVEELARQGCRVIVSDLYGMNFKASATEEDITGGMKNPELFQYGEETMHAWMEGRLTDDIITEQRKVQEADLIIFQFPLYWFSFPAIMKGWIDRVLAKGFAFSLEKMYNNGIFKDKKAILSFTTGATQTMLRPDGINGDINVVLWPLQLPVILSLFPPSERNSALLWISGPRSSDILESSSLSPHRAHRNAQKVAGPAQRTVGRKAFDLCPM